MFMRRLMKGNTQSAVRTNYKMTGLWMMMVLDMSRMEEKFLKVMTMRIFLWARRKK